MAAAAAARQTRGRQRIPMRLIQNQDDLYSSFSKRRFGLFKKGGELSTLCGADLGIIVFSPTDNPFSFFSPSMESVVERYVNPDRPSKHSARAIDAYARSRIQDLNKQLDLLLEQKLKLKQIHEGLVQMDRTRDKGWWEEASVESLDKDQVGVWIAWFKDFKDRVENEIHHHHHQNGGSINIDRVLLAPPSIDHNYFADQDAAAASGLLNLCGGGDDLLGQFYHPSPPPPLDMYGGGGESSQCFYGESSSQGASTSYFSPHEYSYFVGAGGSGGGGGENSNVGGGQYSFPPTYMVEPAPTSVEEHFEGVNQPYYDHHIPSGAQHDQYDDHAAPTSHQGGN